MAERRTYPIQAAIASRLWRAAERERDRYADALRQIRADLEAVAAGAPLDTARMIAAIDQALTEPAPAEETGAEGERRA